MEDDGGSSSGRQMFGCSSDPIMDFDFMDEMLVDGCWMQTTNESESWNRSLPISGAPADTSVLSFPSEINCQGSAVSPPGKQARDVQRSVNEARGSSLGIRQSFGFYEQSQNYDIEGFEHGRRWCAGYGANPAPVSSVMSRIVRALGYIRASTAVDRNILIQVWKPVIRGGARVLTTTDQPFSLDPSCPRLSSYRGVSSKYHFAADMDSGESPGLPGRVFLGRFPEWTPDVRFFRKDEYPRVDFAQKYHVSGTFAVPIFEHGSRTCLGVIEAIMTSQKINYRPEIESVCKALEAVDLSCSGTSDSPNMMISTRSYEMTMPEILEVLRSVCLKHRLPLAQTWVPCIQQGKTGRWHSDENYVNCVSTLDSACFIANVDVWGFHEASSEQHLFKGQGVAGEAFMTNQPCFSPDISLFKKTEYPLSHHARVFGLHAAVAIRLRSIYTGSDFVLELFLPSDCTDHEDQKKMLSSLSIIIQRVCQSLRFLTDKELENEKRFAGASQETVSSEGGPRRNKTTKVEHVNPEIACQEEFSWNASPMCSLQSGGLTPSFEEGKQKEVMIEEYRPLQQDFGPKESTPIDGSYSFAQEDSFSSEDKSGDRRRNKAEKVITLQVLRQYFAGSLKDAAKNLNVCPTTLKRICRQHGIKRWPSRKIKKVGHSLQKLQRVIDSVHSTSSGAFQIDSLYSNIPELASARTGPSTNSNLFDQPKPLPAQIKEGIFGSEAIASKSHSSSSSLDANSSNCCSSGRQQDPSSCNITASNDTIIGENLGTDILERFRGDVELHTSSDEPKCLSQHPNMQFLPSVPNNSARDHVSPEEVSLTMKVAHVEEKIRHSNMQFLPSLPNNSARDRVSPEEVSLRMKVTHREEKIRLRLQNNWGFRDLLQEIVRRFGIDDSAKYHLKYLDDDSEWVLLTCDADLEECIHVYRSLQSPTIKLTLHEASHHSHGGYS